MLPNPTERTVNLFLLRTGIRTVKKLVLALTIHDENVTMAKPARACITVWTGLALAPKLTETMSFASLRTPSSGSFSLCHPTCDLLHR